jgi:hypothetical protein
VPKETKRFINPLLRSSEDNEPRPVPRSQPQSESMSPVQEESIRLQSTDATSEDTLGVQTQISAETGDEASRGMSSSSKASREPSVRKARANAAPVAKQTPSSYGDNAVDDSSELLSMASAALDDDESVIASRQDVPARSRNVARPPVKAAVEQKDQPDEDAVSSDEASNLRRRRNVQLFESTHERITLWINCQLKDQFEDLAINHNISKTKLLNEAIADLLNKYGIH